MISYPDIRLGDVVRMRKPHPCGNYEWQVVRLGADIGIVCTKCSRRVLLPHNQFVRQVKALVRQGPMPTAGEEHGVLPDGQRTGG